MERGEAGIFVNRVEIHEYYYHYVCGHSYVSISSLNGGDILYFITLYFLLSSGLILYLGILVSFLDKEEL